MKYISLIVGCVMFSTAMHAVANVRNFAGSPSAEKEGGTHVVLVGASIGKSWNLPEWPKRVGADRYSFEALQVWEYDKSNAVEETLIRPARKPHLTLNYLKGFFEPSPRPADLIVLKECSSYFGGEVHMQKKKDLYLRWIQEVQQKNIPVMVTTIVPITRARAARDGESKQRAIREFNDWIRAYARDQKLPLLDLEIALRTNDKDRYLRDEYTSGDGSHLNAAAYAVLDRVLLDALCARDGGSCDSSRLSVR